jgi:hypothetical protein
MSGASSMQAGRIVKVDEPVISIRKQSIKGGCRAVLRMRPYKLSSVLRDPTLYRPVETFKALALPSSGYGNRRIVQDALTGRR